MRLRISHSAASSYLNCPYGYAMDHMPSPTYYQASLHLGQVVHAVVARVAMTVRNSGVLPDASEVPGWLRHELDKPHPGLDDDERDRLFDSGLPQVMAHYDRIAPELVGKRGILVEEFFSVELHGERGVVLVTGRIDLAYQDPESGALVLYDYKTGKVPRGGTAGSQLAMYVMYARLQYGLDVEAAEVYLGPEEGTEVLPYPPERLEADLQRLYDVAIAAYADQHFHRRIGAQCAWCSHLPRCADAEPHLMQLLQHSN
ncbi:RecB family exonuclease [Deinococcus depolymerans]|uniref:PD-(D/E)XK endonuclease-like domain-containing protein n=1 Tax=Deinococcus depolymerans TaxID=392408 RepID=A0ABN1CQV8_9DEIO